MRLKHLFLAFVAACVALVLVPFLDVERDVTLGFSKEGCEVLDVMKVPYAAGGDESAPCRLEHASLSATSFGGGYMYHVAYGGFEFDIAKGFVLWSEKQGGARKYR